MAKLDYKEDVDRLHASVIEQLAISQKKAEEALAQNTKLAKQIHDVLDKQQKIFAALGCKPGEGNPVVKYLKDKISGIDDLAKLARKHEMEICNTLGLAPESGWEQALACLEKPAKDGKTRGELSNILLREKKPERLSDTDHSKPKKFVENVGNGSDVNVGKNSFDGQNREASGNAKRVIKRMKI
jgi:hypothetical protein